MLITATEEPGEINDNSAYCAAGLRPFPSRSIPLYLWHPRHTDGKVRTTGNRQMPTKSY